MKRTQLFTLAVLLTGFVAFAFTAAVSTFKVDPAKSTLVWNGKKVTGEHTGSINLVSGSLSLDGNNLKAGEFEIDMNSITCKDLTDAEWNGKLVGHLKSDDFFGSAKFPKAKFVVSKSENKGNGNYDITGNLTIKNITNPVTFPATIQTTGSDVVAKAKITVDRTKYDIKYGSGSFFDNLGDKAIDNNFILDVTLVGKK